MCDDLLGLPARDEVYCMAFLLDGPGELDMIKVHAKPGECHENNYLHSNDMIQNVFPEKRTKVNRTEGSW